MTRSRKWYLGNRLWVEVFVLINLASLAGTFTWPQYEFVSSSVGVCAVCLFTGGTAFAFPGNSIAGKMVAPGVVEGAGALRRLGLGGHCHHGRRPSSRQSFFSGEDAEKLSYAAPFAAPLSYAGLGLLLIMNRMVDAETAEWSYWVLLLTLGGFAGNFLFSVTDHAQNGFYVWTEWIPVASSWRSVF